MPFNANIPLATDTLANSQDDLLQNFIAIGTLLDPVNNQVKLTQGAVPPVALVTQVGMYAADLGGNPELYINKTATQIPFTASLKAAAGWTMLPSGIMLQWGIGHIGAGILSGIINFTIPFNNACLSVQITPIAPLHADIRDAIIGVENMVVASFTASRQAAWVGTAADFRYLAIGY
jgi:hypothetical protein